ncbi:MAG: 2-phosphosulfolactate phosphatase [Clostridia bacterium]
MSAAIARYIKASDAEEVSLVAMGWEGKEEAPEDLLCARYIKSLLEGTSMDMEKELKELRETPSGAKFFKPETQDVFPEGDYWMCTDVDQFDFVLKVSQLEKDIFEVKRIDI